MGDNSVLVTRSVKIPKPKKNLTSILINLGISNDQSVPNLKKIVARAVSVQLETEPITSSRHIERALTELIEDDKLRYISYLEKLYSVGKDGNQYLRDSMDFKHILMLNAIKQNLNGNHPEGFDLKVDFNHSGTTYRGQRFRDIVLFYTQEDEVKKYVLSRLREKQRIVNYEFDLDHNMLRR